MEFYRLATVVTKLLLSAINSISVVVGYSYHSARHYSALSRLGEQAELWKAE